MSENQKHIPPLNLQFLGQQNIVVAERKPSRNLEISSEPVGKTFSLPPRFLSCLTISVQLLTFLGSLAGYFYVEIYLGILGNEGYKYSSFDKQQSENIQLKQVVESWESPLYSKIINQKNCPKGYDPIFLKKWEGMQEGCICGPSITQVQFSSNCKCQKMGKEDEISQNYLELCGLRSVTPLELSQPGCVECPGIQSKLNKICVPYLDLCPINALKIDKFNDLSYDTYLQLDNGYKIITSKTQDSQPLQKFSLGSKMCMNSENSPFENNYYPSELFSGCSQTDPRYQDITSYTVSEHLIQTKSGVLEKIQFQPYSDRFVNFEKKKVQNNQFLVRHSMFYNKQCEIEFSRKKAHETIQGVLSLEFKYQEVTKYIFWGYIFVNFVSLVIYFKLTRKHFTKQQVIVYEFKKLAVHPPILFFNLAVCSALFYFMMTQRKYYYRHKANIQNLVVIQECFDQIVQQEIETFQEIQPKFEEQIFAINICIYCLLGILVIKLTTLCVIQVEYKACQFTCIYNQLSYIESVPKPIRRPSIPVAIYLSSITESEDENVEESTRLSEFHTQQNFQTKINLYEYLSQNVLNTFRSERFTIVKNKNMPSQQSFV